MEPFRKSVSALALVLLVGCGLDSATGTGRATDGDGSTGESGGEAGGGSGMGEHDTLQRSSEVGPGWACRFGGTQFDSGHDNGAGDGTPNDGELHDDEVDDTWFECLDEPPADKLADTGLGVAPLNESCFPPEGPASTGYKLVPAFTQLDFPATPACTPGVNDPDCTNSHRPTALLQHPQTGEWYLAEQAGRVLRFPDSPDATSAQLALDIEDRVQRSLESGLLSLAFDPDDAQSIYVYYIACQDPTSVDALDNPVVCDDGLATDVFGVVSRFTLDGSGDLLPETEAVLLSTPRPTTQLNGGGLTFGADGKLWMAFGDGGEFPSDAAQDPQTLLGKVVRVDVHDTDGELLLQPPYYAIPTDNPFANDGSNARGEIWARGFRNPVGLADVPEMDLGDPVMVVAERGLATAEEVDLVHAGKNYGWPAAEGRYCRATGPGAHKVSVTADTGCIGTHEPPIHDHRHAFGDKIVGGLVYQGSAMPKLHGKYLFADFSTGQLRAIDLDAADQWPTFLVDTSIQIAAFGASEDAKRVYVVDWWSGGIFELVEHNNPASRPPPQLSWTGCVDPEDPTKPAPGYIPYRPSQEAFIATDGNYRERRLYLPPYTVITEYDDTGTIIVPPGSVIAKDLYIEERFIETEFLFRHFDGGWTVWTYRWEEDRSDAVLYETHDEIDVDGQTWVFKDRGECEDCHTGPSGFVLGLRTDQLNSLAYYPQNDVWANQLDTLRSIEVINRVVALDPDEPIGGDNSQFVPIPASDSFPVFPDLDDESYPLLDRVAGYLQTNCAGCHQSGTGVRGPSLLATELLDACDGYPYSQIYDDPEDRWIAPGSPFNSSIYQRLIEHELPYHMHPYVDAVNDRAADVLLEWIETDATLDCAPPP